MLSNGGDAVPSESHMELMQLKEQVKFVDILMAQNAALEGEVTRLCSELDEATKGVLKRGYLHKHRDRTISWASQWGLRYFVLQGNTISYFADERDNRPRRTIDLSHCIVRTDGTKKGGTYHVFCVYLASENLQTAESLILRLSTESKVEATQWIDMLERACALTAEEVSEGFALTWRDSFSDVNKLQNNRGKDEKTKLSESAEGEGDIRRDQDMAHKEEEDWGNSPIDEGLEYPMKQSSDDAEKSSRMMNRVHSSALILNKSRSRTLMGNLLSGSTPNTPNNADGKKSNIIDDTARSKPVEDTKKDTTGNKPVEGGKKIVRVKSFPAFKPMHTSSKSSPLSSDVGPGGREQNYRGFFNLGIIILFLSHFRLAGDNFSKHGLLILPFLSSFSTIPQGLPDWQASKPLQAIASW
eukprot:CAMPEP_0119038616 /NCGR_PEP_ID=MMETSP1177-20130426/7637_1 /TAXON_ID=2985 /ORGANISM="Ochromonas sp, Strain CCMP1899" /LENGTH=412 /DNA_ID=CAMNT_0007001429 /DNA_START=33 /DNA_END=1268 /DNA_ORIENTATION=-